MKVVLFGAGASYGSGDVLPTVPPLGNELFNILSRLFVSTWGQIHEDIKPVFHDNFEHGMGILIEKMYPNIPQLMQDLAIYFSRFDLNDQANNLYVKFFKFLIEGGILKNTIISTLNYECLIEIAANRAGLSVSFFQLPDIADESVSIWKIHGSCNFKLIGIEMGRGVIIGSNNIEFDGDIKVINPSEVSSTYRGNTGLYPCMCLYTKNKPINISPSIIRDAQAKWSEKTRKAEVVCVIGVRPNPEDQHIWDVIAESKGKFVFVGSETDFNIWVEEYRKSKENIYLGRRWDDVFDDVVKILSL